MLRQDSVDIHGALLTLLSDISILHNSLESFTLTTLTLVPGSCGWAGGRHRLAGRGG